jgi:hypothetical protein
VFPQKKLFRTPSPLKKKTTPLKLIDVVERFFLIFEILNPLTQGCKKMVRTTVCISVKIGFQFTSFQDHEKISEHENIFIDFMQNMKTLTIQ